MLVQAGVPTHLRGHLWKIFLDTRPACVPGYYKQLVVKSLGEDALPSVIRSRLTKERINHRSGVDRTVIDPFGETKAVPSSNETSTETSSCEEASLSPSNGDLIEGEISKLKGDTLPRKSLSPGCVLQAPRCSSGDGEITNVRPCFFSSRNIG